MAESKEEQEYNAYMQGGRKPKAAPPKPSLTLGPEAHEAATKEYKKQTQPQSALETPDATAPATTSGFFPAASSAASGLSTQKPAEDMTEEEYNAAMAETQDTVNKRSGPGAEYGDDETVVDEPGKVVPGSFSRGWYKTFGRGKTGFDALKSYNPEVEMGIRGGEEVYKSSKDDVWHRLDPHSYNPLKWVTDPGETIQDVGESAWDMLSGAADTAANTYARLNTGLSGQVAGPAASAASAAAGDVANQAIGNASGYASGYDSGSTALAALLSGGLSSLMGGASKKQVGKHIDDLVTRANKGDREALHDIQKILERNKMGSINKVPEDGSPRTLVKPDAGDVATAKSSLQLDQRGILPLAKDVLFTKGGRPQHLETWAKEAPSPEYMKEVLETAGIQQPIKAPTTRRQLAVWTAKNPAVTSERAMLEAGNSAATMKEALVEKYGRYFAEKDSDLKPTFDLSVIARDMDDRIASLKHPTMTESEREVVRTLEAYKSKFFSLADEADDVSAFESGILDFTGAPIPKPQLEPVSQLVSHQRAFDLLNKAEAELSARTMSKTGGEAIAQRTLADVATTYKDYMYEAVLGPKLRNDFRKSISYRDTLKKYFRDAPTADKNSIGLATDTAGNRIVMSALGEVDKIVREIETARGGIRKDPLTGKLTEGYSVGIVERIKQATIDNHLGNPTDVADYAGGESSNIVRALTMGVGAMAGMEPLTAYTAGQVSELIGNRMKAPRMWNAQLAGAEKTAAIKKALSRILDTPDKLPYGLGSVSKKAKYGMSKATSPWALIKNINTRNQSREEED